MESYIICKNNLKRALRNKTRMIIAVILPILCCLVATMIFDRMKGNLRVGLRFADGVSQSFIQRVEDSLEQSGKIQFEIVNPKSEQTDLILGTYHAIISYENEDDLLAFQLMSTLPQKKRVEQMLQLQEIMQGNNIPQEKKADSLSVTERSVALLTSIFLMMCVLNGTFLIKDRHNGMLERCMCSNCSKSAYYLGNMCYNFILTGFECGIALLLIQAVQSEINLSLFQGIIIVLTITVIASVGTFALCLICKSDVQANLIAAGFTTVATLLSGLFVSIQSMPTTLQWMSTASPVRWMVNLLNVMK